jgi:ferredoxin
VRVSADTSKCQAYGNCLLAAPDVFDLNDDNALVEILQEHPPEEMRPAVEEAVRSCPVEALTLHEG